MWLASENRQQQQLYKASLLSSLAALSLSYITVQPSSRRRATYSNY